MSGSELQCVLQGSSLHTLILIVCKMLGRLGFGDVEILGRRESKQKSRFGGHELVCESRLGSFPIKAIVKVINDSVRLRMLDELAGAVLRTGADIGIIVSPYPISNSVARHLSTYHAARLLVIDGPDLAGRLATLGIGIRPRGGVDYQYFSNLEEIGERARAFIRKEASR